MRPSRPRRFTDHRELQDNGTDTTLASFHYCFHGSSSTHHDESRRCHKTLSMAGKCVLKKLQENYYNN